MSGIYSEDQAVSTVRYKEQYLAKKRIFRGMKKAAPCSPNCRVKMTSLQRRPEYSSQRKVPKQADFGTVSLRGPIFDELGSYISCRPNFENF